MKTKKQQTQVSRQLEEIQFFLKQKDQRPLNFVEAAQYLSISQSTLYKLTYQRKIPAHKPSGKLLYFFKHELDEWISKGRDDTSASLSAGRRTKSDDSSTGSAPVTTSSLGMTKRKKKNPSTGLGMTEDEEKEPP
ncbi:MAG: helix-turn-helix domain-containing protein [Melioribacteraceae bacterium]